MKLKIFIPIIGIILLIAACKKDETTFSSPTVLAGKVWYMEQKNTVTKIFKYYGVSTFSFQLSSESTKYTDSDGLSGQYQFINKSDSLFLSIQLTPSNTNSTFTIKHIGPDQLVMSQGTGDKLETFFFSTRL